MARPFRIWKLVRWSADRHRKRNIYIHKVGIKIMFDDTYIISKIGNYDMLLGGALKTPRLDI